MQAWSTLVKELQLSPQIQLKSVKERMDADEWKLVDGLTKECQGAGCTSLSAVAVEKDSRSESSIGSVVASYWRGTKRKEQWVDRA